MKTYGFLFWAYNVIWLGLAGYLLYLAVRLGRVRRRLDALERARPSGDSAQGSPGS